MHADDDDDLSRQIQSAANYEQEFWHALRIALASPETLKKEFHGLALWMFKSIDASARLGAESTFIDSNFQDVFLGYGNGLSDYTTICEIVHHYNARQPHEQAASEVSSPGVPVPGVGNLRPPQPNHSAATLIKSVTEPPLLPMATKPPSTLSRVTVSEKIASTAGVSPTFGSVRPQAPMHRSVHLQHPMISGTIVDKVAPMAGTAPTNASMHTENLMYDSPDPQHPMVFRTSVDKLASTAGTAPTYDSMYPQTPGYGLVHPQHPMLPHITTDEVASQAGVPPIKNLYSHQYPTVHRAATSDRVVSTAGAAPTSGPVERAALTVGAALKHRPVNSQHSVSSCMTVSEQVAPTAGAVPTVSTMQISPHFQDSLDMPNTKLAPSAGRGDKTWQKLSQDYPYERQRAGSIDRQRLLEEWKDAKEDFGMQGSEQEQMQQLVMDWAMRFGQEQKATGGSLIAGGNPVHRPATNSTNLDDAQRHSAIKTGTSDLVLHGEAPPQKAYPKTDAQLANHPDEQSGERDTGASEGCNDIILLPTDAPDKSKRSTGSGQSRRVKMPPPPVEQRQYYPQPCPRCQENNLPCFLPIVRRASRRTCWHCSDARMKCRHTTNMLLPSAHSRNTLTDKTEANGDEKGGPAKREEEIAFGDVWDLEENEASNIILHTTKIRDGIFQVREDVATLMHCFNRQEQMLTDLTKTCVENQGTLPDNLATALGQIVESAVEVAMNRRFPGQVANYEGSPLQEAIGGRDEGVADIRSGPQKERLASSNFGHLASVEESDKASNTSTFAGSTSGHPVVPLVSQSEERNGHRISPFPTETARGMFHQQRDDDVRRRLVKDEQDGIKDDDQGPGCEAAPECLPGRLEEQPVILVDMEVKMSAANIFELASAPRQDDQSSRDVSDGSNSHNNDSLLLDTSLYNCALSPLSDIPEEEEPSEKEESGPRRRVPPRSTRQSSKRKTSSNGAEHLSIAKKSKPSSKCRSPRTKA